MLRAVQAIGGAARMYRLGVDPKSRLIAARATDERPRLSRGRSCPTLCRPQAS
jgi:hypothetical protein